jgi:hypothetical protein
MKMKRLRSRPATRPAALAGALLACALGFAGTAEGRTRPITGTLDRPGVTVVALAENGHAAKSRSVRKRFHVVPPAKKVTLQLRDRAGAYLGPVVVRGRRGKVVLGVRGAARLGRIRILHGYARTVLPVPVKFSNPAVFARARKGAPIGAGTLGWVRAGRHGPNGPGLDPDRDGIPSKYDVDDDGDLVLDASEHRSTASRTETSRGAARLPLAACPHVVCRGQVDVKVSSFDKADAALAVAIAAFVLATASLLWQVLGARRKRRHRVTVDVRLGLPIYQQGGGDWSVFVEVINATEHPIRWIEAAIELSDGRRLYLMQQPPGGELPVVLQPHDSHQTWTRCRDLEHSGLDLSKPIVGLAKLDSGEVLRSRKRRLMSRSASRRG